MSDRATALRGSDYARLIIDDANEELVTIIVDAINKLTASHHTRFADQIVAFTQMLAQMIAGASPDIREDLAAAIVVMLDAYTAGELRRGRAA